MTFSEYMQLEERAEAAGIGDDESLAQLLHYLQFQEVATRNFQAYLNEMEAWCRNIAKEVESRIKEAEKVVRPKSVMKSLGDLKLEGKMRRMRCLNCGAVHWELATKTVRFSHCPYCGIAIDRFIEEEDRDERA